MIKPDIVERLSTWDVHVHDVWAICREARAEIERLRAALTFARCVIKSGEPWTDICEERIGRALGGK